MKKKFFIGLFAIGVLFFNFIHYENDKKSSFSLANVGLMQANAVEVMCDASHSAECRIESSGGAVGKGTGNLVGSFN